MVPPVPHKTKKSSPESTSTDPSFFGDTSPILVEGPLTVDEMELNDQSKASGVQSEGASVATTETGEEAAPVAFLSHLHCQVRMSQGYALGRGILPTRPPRKAGEVWTAGAYGLL